MPEHTISIPDSLYKKAQQVANQKSLPVDELIRVRLEGVLNQPLFDLPEDEKKELFAMVYLSDDTLWTIAREQMPQNIQDRMSTLMTKNTKGSIIESEYIELESLVERGNRLTLRKAQAMKYLTERGHNITAEDLLPSHE